MLSGYSRKSKIVFTISILLITLNICIAWKLYDVFWEKHYEIRNKYTLSNGDILTIEKRHEYCDPDEEEVYNRFCYNGKRMHFEYDDHEEVPSLWSMSRVDSVEYICAIDNNVILRVNKTLLDFDRKTNKFRYIITNIHIRGHDPVAIAHELYSLEPIWNWRYVGFLVKHQDKKAVADVLRMANGNFSANEIADIKRYRMSKDNIQVQAQQLVTRYILNRDRIQGQVCIRRSCCCPTIIQVQLHRISGSNT